MIYCTAKLTKISKTEAKTEVEWKDNALVIITTKDIKIIPVNDINMMAKLHFADLGKMTMGKATLEVKQKWLSE